MIRSVDVLVVDDRTVDAEVTLLVLRYVAPGARVLRLKTGDQALQYLFAAGEFANRAPGMPGLVLLDAQMPVVSGLCVLDVIRAHPTTMSLPVVMLTASGYSRALRRGDEFDANAYVARPVDLERYCALIRKTLTRWLPQVLFVARCANDEMARRAASAIEMRRFRPTAVVTRLRAV